jgi:hypothetical protein
MRLPMKFSFLAALSVLIGTLVFGQESLSPPSYAFSSGGATLNIPIDVVANGLVFVRTKVNNRPGWFILDNATQGFTVDRDFARKLSLQSGSTAVARGGGPTKIEADILRNVQISFPGLKLTHRNLVEIDLKSLEPTVGHEVDGIIGSRLFDDFVVAIDYHRRSLSIYSPHYYRPSGQEKALPVSIDDHGFQFINATIVLPEVEPITTAFLIDGGSNTYADIYKPFCDAHHIRTPSMKLLDEPGTSTGGTTRARDGRANQITIGPYSVKKPPITFAQDTEGLMAAKDYAGLIGAEFLERFSVVFDNTGKRIFLTPNLKYAEPATYDQSGLRLRADGPGFHRFVVQRIVPQSPAAEAGIEVGDVIESIGPHPARELTLTAIRKVLHGPRTQYTIGILRGDRHLLIAIRLRPLI